MISSLGALAFYKNISAVCPGTVTKPPAQMSERGGSIASHGDLECAEAILLAELREQVIFARRVWTAFIGGSAAAC
jgi:hypothetical protein